MRRPPAGGRPKKPREPGAPEKRQRWIMGLAVAVLALFAARLVYVQVIVGPALATEARDSRMASSVSLAHRGDITDANGVVLATSVDRYTIAADQKNIADFVATKDRVVDGEQVEDGAVGVAQLLAPVLGMDRLELAAMLNGTSGYKVLKKDVPPEVQRQVADLRLQAYIRTDLTSERNYPAGTVAGNLIGFVNTDPDGVQAGQAGAERTFDEQLSGTPGSELYEQARGGQRIPTGEQERVAAEPGKDVRLTVVQDVQWKAQDSVDRAVSDTGADFGIAIVEDVRTGELIALADSGSVNPNDRRTAKVAEGSRAVKDVFAPGSTGKVVTMSALLEGGYETPASQFEVPYHYTTPNGQTFQDSHEHGLERLTLAGILAESSNTGTVMAGQQIPKQVREDYLRKFGFGSVSGLGLPGESAGILADSDDWDGRKQYEVLFGQGIAVNALQATSVFSTIANGGVRMQPSLLAGTVGADGTLVPTVKPAGTRVVSEKTADTVLQMMEAVVDDGTGNNAAIEGYRVAGKTGTAEEVGTDGKLSAYMSSFIGVAPVDDPRYTVSVFLKNPRTSIFGGDVAAPVFNEVMGFTLQHMGVPPSDKPSTPLPTTW